MDESAQYLLVVSYWFFARPITVTLIPFFIYSAFHILEYASTSTIPTPTGSDMDFALTWLIKIQKTSKKWIEEYYSIAMRIVAHSEVVVAARLFLGLFLLRIIPVILFSRFLRFRYHQSTFVRQSFLELRIRSDKLLLPPTSDPRIPPAASNAYSLVKHWLSKFGNAGLPRQSTEAAID